MNILPSRGNVSLKRRGSELAGWPGSSHESRQDVPLLVGFGASSAVVRCAFEGLYILVVYEEIDEDSIRVVTAYEVPEPRSGRST